MQSLRCTILTDSPIDKSDGIVDNTSMSKPYWAVQAGLLTPLTFARPRLNLLATFASGAYFFHNGRRRLQ